MEKNGEFKPEKETPAQKKHQEVVKIASEDLEAKTVVKQLITVGSIKRSTALYRGHHTNE